MKGLEDLGQLSIGWSYRPGMGLSGSIWFERRRKYLGRCLGGSKT